MQLSFIFENLKPRIVVQRTALFTDPSGYDLQSEELGDKPCRFLAHAAVPGNSHTYGLYPALNNAAEDLVGIVVGASRTKAGDAWLIGKLGDTELFRMGYFPQSDSQRLAGEKPQLRLLTASKNELMTPIGPGDLHVFPGLHWTCFPHAENELFGVSVQRARVLPNGSLEERANRPWVMQLPQCNFSYQFTAAELAA